MSNWRPLKSFCIGLPQYGLNVPARDYVDSGTRFLRTSDINDRGDVSDVQSVYIQESIIGPEYRLIEGDLLLSRSGTLGRCLRYQPSLGSATFAGYLIRFRPSHANEPRYVEYCTHARFFQQAIEAEAPSSTISNFNAERYANLSLPWWPSDRQRAIADYLDTETSRIDALITKKRHMIELLEQRNQALIDEKIASSGAPLVAVRRVAPRITSGPRGWAQYASDYGTLFLRITNIDREDIRLNTSDTLFVNAPRTAESRRTEVRGGDVLVSITADIGSVGIVPDKLSGANVSQHVALVRPSLNIHPKWLAYAIKSTASQIQLDAGQYGGTKTQLSLGDIAALRVPWPRPRVQDHILSELEPGIKCTRFSIQFLRRQLALLAERRQALITRAVTGELAAPWVEE